MPLEELEKEHRELEEQAARLMDIIQHPVPDPASVAAIRWKMAQALFDHCAHEDRLVYDRLLASGDAAATPVAWTYRQEHGALVPGFGRFIAEWPVDRIAREWQAFGAAARDLIAFLAQRIASEERILYPLAERMMARRNAA